MAGVWNDKEANWNLIPHHCREGLRRWIESGIVPGHFLCAVIQNDLAQAVNRADMTNSKALRGYVQFLHNYAPSGCWGSPDNFRAWKERGGAEGKEVSAEVPRPLEELLGPF